MIIKLREASKSMVMWVILGVLALAFGLSFGLPSDAITLGTTPIAKVYGESLVGSDFAYQEAAIKLSPMVQIPKNDPRMQELMGVKEETIDAIVERRVLAKVGEEMGLESTTQDAEDLTFRGHLIVMGDTFDWLGGTKFNYEKIFKGWLLRRLRVNERDYLEVQRQEIIARTVRDVVTSSVVIPEPELRKAYDEQANQMSLRYVRFQNAHYADLVDPKPEEIDAYVSEHSDELKQQYTSQGVRFSKLPKQVRLRFIQVKRPTAAAEDADDEAKKAVADKDAQAREKIEQAAAALKEGKDFRQVAREFSEDPSTARRGGDYDWVSLEGTGSGLEAIVDDTAKTLQPAETSEIVSGDEGYYIVHIDGLREGDVPEADALRELAVEALMRDGGKALARQAADEALLKLKEEAGSLEKMFQAPDALGATSPGIESLGELGSGTEADSRPKISETGLFAKGKPIPGIGPQPDLITAAWEADPKAEVIEQVFETDDGFLLAKVDRKEQATDEGFAEQREEIYTKLAERKALQLNSLFANSRCLEAKARGHITTNAEILKRFITYDTNLNQDEQGKQQMRPYSMCDRVGMRGSLMRLAAFGGARMGGN